MPRAATVLPRTLSCADRGLCAALHTPIDADIVLLALLLSTAFALAFSGCRAGATWASAATCLLLAARGLLERLKMQFAANQQLEQEVTRRFFPRHWRSIARTCVRVLAWWPHHDVGRHGQA